MAKSEEEDLSPQNSQSEKMKWEGGGAKSDLLQAMPWLWCAARTPSGPHALRTQSLVHEQAQFLPLAPRGRADRAALGHL